MLLGITSMQLAPSSLGSSGRQRTATFTDADSISAQTQGACFCRHQDSAFVKVRVIKASFVLSCSALIYCLAAVTVWKPQLAQISNFSARKSYYNSAS